MSYVRVVCELTFSHIAPTQRGSRGRGTCCEVSAIRKERKEKVLIKWEFILRKRNAKNTRNCCKILNN